MQKILTLMTSLLLFTINGYCERPPMPYLELEKPPTISKPQRLEQGDTVIEYTVKEANITSSNSGFLLGDIGCSIEEAADITVIGPVNTIPGLEHYRNILSVKGSSSLVLQRNETSYLRYLENTTEFYAKPNKSYFCFSNGRYYADQQPDCKIWYLKNTVYSTNSVLKGCSIRASQIYTLDGNTLDGLDKIGIPCIRALYGDSISDPNITYSMDKVLINGNEAFRYTIEKDVRAIGAITDNPVDHLRMMYFFDLNGRFTKFATEHTLGSGNGSPKKRTKGNMYYTTNVYDVLHISTTIEDEMIFYRYPTPKGERPENYIYFFGIM